MAKRLIAGTPSATHTAQTDTGSAADPRSFSRRTFVRTGSLGALAAGVLASVPGLSGLVGGASAAAPEVGAAAVDGETIAPDLSGPIVAHVTNAASGELNLYFGEREVPWRDPVLVQHLLRAAR